MPALIGQAKTRWIWLLSAVLMIPSAIWIGQDYHVWPWDQAWYGEVSVDCWFLMWRSRLEWLNMMSNGLSLKPPLIAWIGQFFLVLNPLLGQSERSLLVSIVATQMALLMVLWLCGRAVAPGSRYVPTVGVIFGASGQLFAGMSHQYFVEPLQAVAVAWGLLIALRAREWSKAEIVVHVAGCLTMGLLSKATTPVYSFFPLAYAAYVFFRRPADGSFRSKPHASRFQLFATVIAISAAIGALWYLMHLSGVWTHIREATSGDVAADYATPGTTFDRFRIWLSLLNQSFLTPYLVWALVPLAVLAGWCARRKAFFIGPFVIAGLCAVQLGLLLYVFSINTMVEPRYMYAFLPYLAVLFMQICSLIPDQALLMLGLVCGVQWGVVSYASLEQPRSLGTPSVWLIAPERNPSQMQDLSQAIHLTSTAIGRYSMTAIELPWINSNSAAFYAAKNRLETGVRSYYTSIGYAQKDPDAALRRIEEYRTRYVLIVDETAQKDAPGFLNVATMPVLERMRADARFKLESFPNPSGILIYRFEPGLAAQ